VLKKTRSKINKDKFKTFKIKALWVLQIHFHRISTNFEIHVMTLLELSHHGLYMQG